MEFPANLSAASRSRLLPTPMLPPLGAGDDPVCTQSVGGYMSNQFHGGV